MKKLQFLGIVLALAPTGGCITLGVLVGNKMVSNPEMIMLLKVTAYLLVAIALIGIILLMLIGVILAIGKGLGLSQGDTRAALQAAIALARSSNAINKLLPRKLLSSGQNAQTMPNYYQVPLEGSAFGQVINGEASMPPGTEPATGDAWER